VQGDGARSRTPDRRKQMGVKGTGAASGGLGVQVTPVQRTGGVAGVSLDGVCLTGKRRTRKAASMSGCHAHQSK
jgi:hypothetical protein